MALSSKSDPSMEVKLDKRYPVAASLEQAWALLADLPATAACMPGASITEQIDETHFKGQVKSKVGPAVMQFGGEIELLALETDTHTLEMLGKGADKAGSSATMKLKASLEPGEAPGTCVLLGQASIMVGGKLAQFGSRLLVPVSDALLAQFAANFSTAAAAISAPGAGALTEATAPATAAVRVPLPTPQAAAELNALALMWTVLKSWMAGFWRPKN